MATTTTNYGFDVPTSSDLVKNGATAIAELGQDIDTFLLRPFAVNPVLNSAFQIAQRGTSIPNTGSFLLYTLDRWQFNSNNSGRTVSRQLTADSVNLPFVQYCARISRDSGVTDVTANRFAQSFESANSVQFANKRAVLSFYARKGANYSAASNTLNAQVISGTGTDQSVISGFTGANVEINQNFTLTNTWQKFSVTKVGLLSTTLNQLAVQFTSTPTGTAGAADYFEITGVMLEEGTVSTPFRTNQPTLATELAACQRYYWRPVLGGTADTFGLGLTLTATTSRALVNFPVSMRTAAPILTYSNLAITDQISYTLAVSSAAIQSRTNLQSELALTHATGATVARPAILIANSSSAAFVAFDTEL